MAVVAQAQVLALDPAFTEYDRIDFRVPARLSPQRQVKWLKEQAAAKGRKLLDLQKSYTAVVNLKQAEPAVCALYKIGLAYSRFAKAFKEAPIPAELRREKALAEEYRSQLAQLAEAPEKKSVEALEYALSKSRELGVANACTRSVTELLARHRPDSVGPTLEKMPELAAPAGASRTQGHRLLGALYQPPPPSAAPAASPALPPLADAPRGAAAPARVSRAPIPDGPEHVADPTPPRRRQPVPPLDDEDLLP
jgi:hypothetical protein